MEVNVWVNNREKKVKGLTKRTTCHDVITALLYNKTKADKLADDYIETYVLIEQWRECERILPRNTKIIKIWRSWHNEQPNVKFLLRKKTKEFRPANKDGGKVSKPKEIPERLTRKKRKTGEKNNRRARSVERSDQQEHIKWLNEQNSHRISRSNDELFKSQTCEQQPPSQTEPPAASEGLVELVMGQEEQLHDLIETIRQTDLEIEYYETQMHLCRVYANGKDYVQESYLSTTTADNEVSTEQIPAVSGAHETHPHEPSIRKIDKRDEVSDINCNEVTVTQRPLQPQKEYPDNDKLRTITNLPNVGLSCDGKGKKRVTFAKLDSRGHRICADSLESLNNIGLEKKNEQIITESTIYETCNPNDSSPAESDEPSNRINSEHRVNPNSNIKGILVVKNNNSKHNMVTQQTQSMIWDQNDTDSSSDTGLSSMQDSEDGGAVHVSVTLV